MLFNSLAFLAFLPAVYVLYLRLDNRRQNQALVVASYVFYGWWDWRFCLLLLLSTVVDYLCGAAIAASRDPGRRRWLLAISLAVNLGSLGFFKYFDFFSEAAAGLLSALGMRADPFTLHVILPVGISF
jgi:D-alanyl-lipoteichoic acid acyltransferase DltB (MBOAT superfamily)